MIHSQTSRHLVKREKGRPPNQRSQVGATRDLRMQREDWKIEVKPGGNRLEVIQVNGVLEAGDEGSRNHSEYQTPSAR